MKFTIMTLSMLFVSSLLFSTIIVFISNVSGLDLGKNLNTSFLRYFNDSNPIVSGSKNFSSASDSSELYHDKNNGVLIVKVTTINADKGINKSSDFTVNVHANDPVPATFKGNSSGTVIQLPMGMYSVTISSIANYNSSLSNDCAGGIMEVETITCDITNTFINLQINTK